MEPATSQHETIAPVRPDFDEPLEDLPEPEASAEIEPEIGAETEPETGVDWDGQPAQMTTREVATLFGKSPGNIRARASRGDFGNTVTGDDGLPRYDRGRVRAVYERITAREAQARAVTNLYATMPGTQMGTLSPSLPGVIAGIQAQHQEQITLWAARLAEAQQIALQAQTLAQQAQHESHDLRELLRLREETTRETLSHMDTLYSETIAQLRETLAQQQTRIPESVAPPVPLPAAVPQAALPMGRPSLWQRLFGGS